MELTVSAGFELQGGGAGREDYDGATAPPEDSPMDHMELTLELPVSLPLAAGVRGFHCAFPAQPSLSNFKHHH